MLTTNANAQFSLHQTWATDYSPLLAEADLDGDGDLDLICGRYWMRLGPDGSYEIAQRFPESYSFYAIVPVDYDADGDVDLLANAFTTGYLLRNNAGTFELESFGSDLPITGVDFDSDGDIDIVVASGSRLACLINEQGLEDAERLLMQYEASGDFLFCMSDLNGDNVLDICTCDSYQCDVEIYGAGSYEFMDAFTTPFQGQTRSVALFDYNDDGLIDALYTHSSSSDIFVRYGTATNEFSDLAEQIGNDDYLILGNADLDGDGIQDLIKFKSDSFFGTSLPLILEPLEIRLSSDPSRPLAIESVGNFPTEAFARVSKTLGRDRDILLVNSFSEQRHGRLIYEDNELVYHEIANFDNFPISSIGLVHANEDDRPDLIATSNQDVYLSLAEEAGYFGHFEKIAEIQDEGGVYNDYSYDCRGGYMEVGESLYQYTVLQDRFYNVAELSLEQESETWSSRSCFIDSFGFESPYKEYFTGIRKNLFQSEQSALFTRTTELDSLVMRIGSCGDWGEPSFILKNVPKVHGFTTIDFGGDGYVDVVVATAIGGQWGIYILENDQQDSFYAPRLIVADDRIIHKRFLLRDLNKDGLLDILLVQDELIEVLLQDETGSFELHSQHAIELRDKRFSLVDYDLDGDQDLIVEEINGTKLLTNNGNNDFQSQYLGWNGGSSGGFIHVDLFGDAFPELIRFFNNNLYLYANDLSGSSYNLDPEQECYDPQQPTDFSIVVNPVQDQLQVQPIVTTMQYAIYGLAGRKLLEGQIGSLDSGIDVSRLVTGYYLIELWNQHERSALSFLVAR